MLITSQPAAVVRSKSREIEKIQIQHEDVAPDIFAFIKSGITGLALDETQSTDVRNQVRKKLEEGAQGTLL